MRTPPFQFWAKFKSFPSESYHIGDTLAGVSSLVGNADVHTIEVRFTDDSGKTNCHRVYERRNDRWVVSFANGFSQSLDDLFFNSPGMVKGTPTQPGWYVDLRSTPILKLLSEEHLEMIRESKKVPLSERLQSFGVDAELGVKIDEAMKNVNPDIFYGPLPFTF